MDTESERVYQRMRLYFFLKDNPDWSNRRCAKDLDVSEKFVRTWRKRFETDQPHTIQLCHSRSRAPHNRCKPVAPAVKDAIGDLRVALTEKYHRKAGARLIIEYLKRMVTLKKHKIPKSTRTVTNVLRELGYIVSRPKRIHTPLDIIPPMEEWEMDFCEVEVPHEGKFEFFVVVDRGTSRVVHLEGRQQGYNAQTALEAVFGLLDTMGLPKRLRLDRDPRFVASWSSRGYPAPLIRFLRVIGVEPVICPPRRPDLKPYVERCIGSFKNEWLTHSNWSTLGELLNLFPQYVKFHNSERIHQGRACNHRTPDEAFPDLPELPKLPPLVKPNSWIDHYDGRVFHRMGRVGGAFQVDKEVYHVKNLKARQGVLIRLDASLRSFQITQEGNIKLAPVAMQRLLPEDMTLFEYFNTIKDEAISIAYHNQITWKKKGDEYR